MVSKAYTLLAMFCMSRICIWCYTFVLRVTQLCGPTLDPVTKHALQSRVICIMRFGVIAHLHMAFYVCAELFNLYCW